MSQLKVRNALESKLAAFATSKSTTVVWENIKTLPTTSYLKAFIFPADTQDPSIGSHHQRYRGAFRVMYLSTDIGKGMKAFTQFVDELVAYFPRGSKIDLNGITVQIDSTPSVRSVGYEGNFIYQTVDIFYRCDIVT